MCTSVVAVLNTSPPPDGSFGRQCCAVGQNHCWAEAQHLLLWAVHGLGLVLIWRLRGGGMGLCLLQSQLAFGTQLKEPLSPDEVPVLWDLVVPWLFPQTSSPLVPKSVFFIPFRKI